MILESKATAQWTEQGTGEHELHGDCPVLRAVVVEIPLTDFLCCEYSVAEQSDLRQLRREKHEQTASQ